MAGNSLSPGMPGWNWARCSWMADPLLWTETFVTVNLAILALDIWIAHSMNQFRVAAEYIPLWFSAGAPALLVIGMLLRWVLRINWPWVLAGYSVGGVSVLIGLAGVIYHLRSAFFLEHTLRSLTYAAPFAAPMAYAGLGFLLLMDRMVAADAAEWAQWVFFLALGGFFGNYVLSLTDHATNGFFLKMEWAPVISSALATGFLIVPLILPITRRYLDLCLGVLVVQALIGVVGFCYHMRANLVEPGHSLFEKLVNGAPPLAPLLFPNLVGLALIGIWALAPHVPETSPSWVGAARLWLQRAIGNSDQESGAF